MKSRLISLLLIFTLSLSGCGGGDTASQNAPEEADSPVAEASGETNPPIDETPEGESSEEEADNLSDLEALGDVEVEKQLFDVTLTIPADYVEATTQEELDEAAKEHGYQAKLNEDGSATYTMTKKQHKEMMEELTASMQEELDDMIESETYPSITNVEANSDFTEFTVTTKNEKLDMTETFSVITFYMYGGMYSIFNGTEIDNIHVDFVNADSGEVISSHDSKYMGKTDE